ncbi:MAG: hypothetical protein WAO57_00505 [Syntrophomonadaceae bacterium]
MMSQIENEKLHQVMRQGRTITAQIGAVERLDEPTWILSFPDYPSFRGLIPLSASGGDEPLMYAMNGQQIQVVIKGIDGAIIACSRKEAVEKVQEQVMAGIKQDDILPVTVVAVVNREKRPVLIIDVGQGVLCEIPRSKAAVKYTVPLRQQHRPGQIVPVKVLTTDPVTLSVRDGRPDPWTLADFRRGSIISGTVYQVQGQHVFLEPDLCMGILGLAPVPLMGDVARGMRVTAKVRYFSPDERKLHLWLTNTI